MQMLMFLLLVGVWCQASKLPSSFKKCSKSSGDFNQCLSKAVGYAIALLNTQKKDVGLPSLEPLDIPTMKIGAGTGPVQFDQNYKNFKAFGLTKTEDMKVEMNQDQKTLTLDFSYPEIRFVSDYEINGKILMLPINGKGVCTVVLVKPRFVLKFYLEEYDKKDGKHYKVKKYQLTIDPEKIHFQLDNLFNGDKALGDNINNVMNDNWKEVFEDVKASYEDAFGLIFSKFFGNMLEKIPVAEIFDP